MVLLFYSPTNTQTIPLTVVTYKVIIKMFINLQWKGSEKGEIHMYMYN